MDFGVSGSLAMILVDGIYIEVVFANQSVKVAMNWVFQGAIWL